MCRRRALAATEIGDAVHRLLELVDLSAPALARRCVVRTGIRGDREELERIAAFVDAYCDSALARASPRSTVRPERPFAFEHDGVLLHGRLDVLWREGAACARRSTTRRTCSARHADEIVEDEYRLQRLVYALACFRAGADEVEVVYQFLERPDAVVSTTFARHELPGLEAELSEAIAGSTPASSCRRRASSRARAARRATSFAPGRGCARCPRGRGRAAA